MSVLCRKAPPVGALITCDTEHLVLARVLEQVNNTRTYIIETLQDRTTAWSRVAAGDRMAWNYGRCCRWVRE